jgi:hypothetical protein
MYKSASAQDIEADADAWNIEAVRLFDHRFVRVAL